MAWTAPITWTTGRKVSALDMNTEIRDHLNELFKFTAKGSLVVATSAIALADFPVGTNNYVVTADSTQTAGIKWANPATNALLTAAFAPIAKGVTNGDSHNHSGGDGAQIAHGDLSGLGTASGHVTNGNSHDHSGGDGAQIPTGGIADNAIDDTKVGNRVPQFYRRQGGSSTVWSTYGTNNYTPTTVRMQGGTARWTGNSFTGTISITFDTAFSYAPIIFCTAQDYSTAHVAIEAVATTSGATITWASMYDGLAINNNTYVIIQWLAIGPE